MEWHTLLLLSDILQILGGFLDMHTLYGLGSFTSEHEDLNLLICMILWGFLGQVNSAPFLGVTSGRLPEKPHQLLNTAFLAKVLLLQKTVSLNQISLITAEKYILTKASPRDASAGAHMLKSPTHPKQKGFFSAGQNTLLSAQQVH